MSGPLPEKEEGRLPEERGMEMALITTQALFKNRQTLRDSSFENCRRHVKWLLGRISDRPAARTAIGNDPQLWKDLNQVFLLAIPILKAQSLPADDAPPGTDMSTSALMALHHDTLITDLDRLNDLLLMGRNCVATVQRAQNLAGESLIDQQVLRLIELAVRVTAQGYDGEAGSRLEQPWANVTAGYKKLLITCLQFLHNLVMQNEQRKLLLWLDLFANSKVGHDFNILSSHYRSDENEQITDETGDEGRGVNKSKDESAPAAAIAQHTPKTQDTLHAEATPQKTSQDMKGSEQDAKTPTQLQGANKSRSAFTESSDSFDDIPNRASENPAALNGAHSPKQTFRNADGSVTQQYLNNGPVRPDRGDEFGPLKTPESAADTLQAAKNQLMARLADPSNITEDSENTEAWTGADGSEAAGTGQEDDDQEPGDQQRGLLTDIPLVLGPQEIEALPMIVQMGICPGHGAVLHGKDMQAMRCNILLAGDAGRNLLRELLIFIAAWDLQDDELYFKLMMQIMEAVLDNGLMPYAYQTFAEVKDIVSPAQSMVIKILTQIFRGKKEDQDKNIKKAKGKGKEKEKGGENPHANASRRVDIYIVRYIFTIFRSSIIPETCALIYLQGQIKNGAASPEDFPLNLWDMERVYEGVYQFLEFFAVLTESEEWKELLVNWEIVSELVTLLRELEASIPKAPLHAGSIPQTVSEAYNSALQQQAEQMTHLPNPTGSGPVPVAVERPFEVSPPAPTAANGTAQPATYNLPSPLAPTAELSEQDSVESSDPSDFEWRNLKKLVILVLSSLVWKSPRVQEQIRKHGGVQLVIACCNLDGNNPYIKEHAVMCLRFLLENDRQNQEILMGLQQMGKHKSGHAGEAADLGDVGGEVTGAEQGVSREHEAGAPFDQDV